MQSAQPTPVDVFLRTHPDRGGLRVQVTCGGGRFPVAGAQVVISRAFWHGGAHILPGRHRRLRYPIRPSACPPRPLPGLKPRTPPPSAGWTIRCRYSIPCSSRWLARTATVFDGVETILPVMLEPVV